VTRAVDPSLWPSARDYVQALADPSANLRSAALREVRVRPGMFGLPAAATGQNAVVLPVDGPDGAQALRCFTRRPADATRHRYRLLEQHLRREPHPSLTTVRWLEDEVLVDGRPWPVVVMPWLPGDTLHTAVEDRLGDADRLRGLARRVRAMVRELHEVRVAHGDLQHGNILVDEDDAIRLVDYDSVLVVGAETLVPDEVGHPAYQHPERLRTAAWGPGIDTFSALVIETSLLALGAEPDLFASFHDGENLVLGADDYAAPATSAALGRLLVSPDPEVVRRARLLRACLDAPLARLTSLEEVLATDPDALVAARPDSAPGARPEWVGGRGRAAEDRGWDEVPEDWAADAPATAPDFHFDPDAPVRTRRRRWGRRRQG
jgi:hypothetical protein